MPEVALADLWLPILLSAVFVFIASSVIHMATPWHKGDYGELPGEEGILAAMRGAGVTPGTYMFPYCRNMKEMGSEEHVAKMNAGPVGFMNVLPNGPMKMGGPLIAWFVYSLFIGFFVAYIATFTVQPGAEYDRVFRVVGTAAILGYALSSFPESMWKGQPWAVSLRFMVDGLIYGLLTAGTFGWLWPSA